MASPFLLISIGVKGEKVVKDFVQELENDVPRYFSSPETLHEPSEESYLRVIENLLRAQRQQSSRGNNRIFAWIVGDLAEGDIPEHILQQGNQLKRYARANFPDLEVHLETLLLIPRGRFEKGKAITKFLESLSQKESPFFFCWLLSSDRHLLGEEVAGVAVRFLLVNFLTNLSDRIWAHSQHDLLKTRLGTFGLSGIIIPAKGLIRKEATRVSIQILDEILKDDPGPLDAGLLDDFLQGNRLTMDELKARLLEGARIAFSEKERKVTLEAVDPILWSDKLWSIYYFFVFGGLSAYFGTISQNLGRKWKEVAEDLTNRVAHLVEWSVRPSSILSILKELEKKASSLKADRVSLGSGRNILQKEIEVLKKAYVNFPSHPGAAVLRVVLLSVVIAYISHLLLPEFIVLPRLPTFIYFVIAFGLSGIFVGIVGVLSYMSKRNRFRQAKNDAQGALWGALESALDAKAHNGSIEIFERLERTSSRPEDDKKKSLPCESKASEYSNVLQYIVVLNEALDQLKSLANENYEKIPVFRYLDSPVSYRKGEYNSFEEARILVEAGLHKGWRETNKEETVRRLLQLTSTSLTPIKQIEETLLEMREENIRSLGEELLERASSFVSLISSGTNELSEKRYLFVTDSRNSILPTKFGLKYLDQDHILSTGDPHNVTLLRTFFDITPEKITAFETLEGGGNNAG